MRKIKVKRYIELAYYSIYNFKVLTKRYTLRKFHPSFLNELIVGQDLCFSPNRLNCIELGKKNKGVTVVIIKLSKEWIPTAGFFALLHKTLCGLYFADRLGLCPVVFNWDGCAYEEDSKVNDSKIVFEYYFNRVSNITVQDSLNSQNVIIPTELNYDMVLRKYDSEWFNLSNDYIEEIGRIYRKYIHLNEYTKNKINQDIKSLLNNKKTLAIHFRGSDYRLNTDGHPMSLEIEDYFKYIDYALKQYSYEQIFLATDDSNAVLQIKNKYNNVVCYNDTMRTDGDVSVAFLKNERENHKFQLGYEVLRDAYTLADCDALIAGYSQVSVCARINKASLNKKYEYCKIIDKGINHNDTHWTEIYKKDIMKRI